MTQSETDETLETQSAVHQQRVELFQEEDLPRLARMKEEATKIHFSGRARQDLAGAISKLQTDIEADIQRTERLQKITKAGYLEVQSPPKGWVRGFPIDDPRPDPQPIPWWAWPAAVMVALIIFPILLTLLILFFADGDVKGVYTTTLATLKEGSIELLPGLLLNITVAGIGAVVCALLGILFMSQAPQRRNRASLRIAGLPLDATRFLKVELPQAARDAIDVAQKSGHFTLIEAWALEQAFQETDPVPFTIFGKSGLDNTDFNVIYEFDPQRQGEVAAASG